MLYFKDLKPGDFFVTVDSHRIIGMKTDPMELAGDGEVVNAVSIMGHPYGFPELEQVELVKMEVKEP